MLHVALVVGAGGGGGCPELVQGGVRQNNLCSFRRIGGVAALARGAGIGS